MILSPLRRSAVTAFAAAAIVAACSASPESRSLIGYVPPSAKPVGQVSATEIIGSQTQQFAFRAAPGEVLVVMFGYTNCPDICPTTLANLKNAKQKIGDLAARVDIAMVTVDPERDTADILPRYLSSFTDRFHAVIPADVRELNAVQEAFQASSSVTKVDGRVEVNHTGTAYVVDDSGTVVVEWPFGIDTPSMTSDLITLLTQKETAS